jgi:hypothetical protein
MTSEKALRAAAKEMNEVMDGLDPAIDLKAKLPVLTEQMKEAIKFIDPDEDEFTKATQTVIDELSEGDDDDDEEEEKPKSKKGKKAPADDDDDDDDDEEDDEPPVKKKKATPVEDDEDDDDDDDDEDDEEEEEKPKKGKEKKSPKKGGIKKAGKEGGPGIIQTIVSLVEKAGKKGISKKEILAQLQEDFPDRNEQSMKNTVNVQVPARINKEKFPVKKVGDDRYTKA